MDIKIQPGANGYLMVTQTRPQAGELVIHVSEVEKLVSALKKADLESNKSEKRGPEASSKKQ